MAYRNDDRPDLAWEEISTQTIVRDEWIDFRKSSYRFPDGRIFEPYYSYSRRSYVVIAAQTKDGRFLCVRQFRQGIREVTTEFPAGCIEKSDGEGIEGALKAARRELLEETGCTAQRWVHLLTVPSNATLADNYAYVFFAGSCREIAGQKLDETECLNVELHSADEIDALVAGGRFQQAVHVMAWLLAKNHLGFASGDGS